MLSSDACWQPNNIETILPHQQLEIIGTSFLELKVTKNGHIQVWPLASVRDSQICSTAVLWNGAPPACWTEMEHVYRHHVNGPKGAVNYWEELNSGLLVPMWTRSTNLWSFAQTAQVGGELAQMS